MQPRPTGVTVIAILHFIGAGFATLAGVGAIFGMGFLSMMAAHNSRLGGAMLAGLGVVLAIILFIVAAVAILIGWGLWRLHNWARVTAIVFSGIAILGAMSGVVMLHFAPFLIVGGVVRLAIAVGIIWYLLQPHVKTAFGAKEF